MHFRLTPRRRFFLIASYGVSKKKIAPPIIGLDRTASKLVGPEIMNKLIIIELMRLREREIDKINIAS